MTTRKCSVPGCNLISGDIILHKFPNPVTDLVRFEAWLKSVGGHILLLDKHVVFGQYRVCHKHFESKYHSPSGRVTRNAVPTLLLSGQQTLREPLQAIINIMPRQQLDSEKVLVGFPSSSKSEQSNEVPALMSVEPVPSTSKQSDSPISGKSMSLISKQDSPPTLRGHMTKQYMTSSEVVLGTKIKKLQKSKETIQLRLKKALKLSENPTFQKALKSFSSPAVIFTMLQFREAKKKILGRRFKKSEKVMALALYKQGPRAYRWLRKFFVLPSPLTLSRMISNTSLRPGFVYCKKRLKK